MPDILIPMLFLKARFFPLFKIKILCTVSIAQRFLSYKAVVFS